MVRERERNSTSRSQQQRWRWLFICIVPSSVCLMLCSFLFRCCLWCSVCPSAQRAERRLHVLLRRPERRELLRVSGREGRTVAQEHLLPRVHRHTFHRRTGPRARQRQRANPTNQHAKPHHVKSDEIRSVESLDPNWLRCCSTFRLLVFALVSAQWAKYLENIAKADCAAALRRVLSAPPQVNVKDAGLKCEGQSNKQTNKQTNNKQARPTTAQAAGQRRSGRLHPLGSHSPAPLPRARTPADSFVRLSPWVSVLACCVRVARRGFER